MTDENGILKELAQQARDELAETELPSDLKGFDPALAERILQRLAEDSVAADDGSPATTGDSGGHGGIKKLVQASFSKLWRKTRPRRVPTWPIVLAYGTGVALAASLGLVLLGEGSRRSYQLGPNTSLNAPLLGSSTEEPRSKAAAPFLGSTSSSSFRKPSDFRTPEWGLSGEDRRPAGTTVTFGDDGPPAPKPPHSNNWVAPSTVSSRPAAALVQQTRPKSSGLVGMGVSQPSSATGIDEAPDGGPQASQAEASNATPSSRSMVASAAEPAPGKAGEAQTLFDEAVKLMRADHYAEACLKLEASQRLAPAIGTLLYLALCNEREGRLVAASTYYLEAQRMARAAGLEKQEALARERASVVASRLSRVAIETEGVGETPGLRISLDGANIGHESWSTPIPADVGIHTLRATAPGKKSWETTVQVAADAGITRVRVPALEGDVAVVRPNDGLADHDRRR